MSSHVVPDPSVSRVRNQGNFHDYEFLCYHDWNGHGISWVLHDGLLLEGALLGLLAKLFVPDLRPVGIIVMMSPKIFPYLSIQSPSQSLVTLSIFFLPFRWKGNDDKNG
jgi:hypothetical protein